MSLVISLKDGEDVFFGEDRLIVDGVFSANSYTLKNPKTGKAHHITDKEAVEVLPNVTISAGDGQQQFGVVRLTIDAPRDVIVLRGSRKRQQEEEACRTVTLQ